MRRSTLPSTPRCRALFSGRRCDRPAHLDDMHRSEVRDDHGATLHVVEWRGTVR